MQTRSDWISKVNEENQWVKSFTVFHYATLYLCYVQSYSSLLTWLQTFLYDQILICVFKLDIAMNYTSFLVKCLRVTDVMKKCLKIKNGGFCVVLSYSLQQTLRIYLDSNFSYINNLSDCYVES